MTDYRYTIGHNAPMFDTPWEAEEWAAGNVCGTYSVICLVWDDHTADWVEEGHTYQDVCAEIRRLVGLLRSCGWDVDDRWQLVNPAEIELPYQELRDELSELHGALNEQRVRDRAKLAAWNAGRPIRDGI
jgi:hypothetical protein